MSSEAERTCFHALNILSGSTYRTLEKWRIRHGSWEAAWTAEGSGPAEAAWVGLRGTGVRLILADESDFPTLLREIPWPPFGIYLLGFLPPEPRLAVVGTRKATAAGLALAHKFSAELTRAGLTVVNGLALGIDAAAQEGALEARGAPLAVLANGLPDVYPRRHIGLARRILAAGGGLLSEYPPATPPLPYRFLERNRLVSGLARGALILEASERSGSLVTARYALDQNRDVFVVPGPATHPNFRGSHQLIRAGAELVTESGEILASLGLSAPGRTSLQTDSLSAEERAVVDVLARSGGSLPIDKIIELTKLKAPNALTALSFLIIKRVVLEDGSGYTLLP